MGSSHFWGSMVSGALDLCSGSCFVETRVSSPCGVAYLTTMGFLHHLL